MICSHLLFTLKQIQKRLITNISIPFPDSHCGFSNDLFCFALTNLICNSFILFTQDRNTTSGIGCNENCDRNQVSPIRFRKIKQIGKIMTFLGLF